jgi:hypothetical protein
MIARYERDVGTEANGRKRTTLGNRIEDKREVAEGHFEALTAVMRDDHINLIIS